MERVMTMVTILSEGNPVAFATLVRHDLGISLYKAAPNIGIADISPTGFLLKGQFDLHIEDSGLVFVDCKVMNFFSHSTVLIAGDVINEDGYSVLP
jgi:hypothetical protein